MTPLAIGALVAATAFAVLDWWAVATGRLAVERVAKPAVIVALIIVAIGIEPVVAEPVRSLALAALGASLVGDVLLLPGGRFTGGVVAFAVAQVAYAASFLLRPIAPPALFLGVAVGAVVAAVVGRPILGGAPARLRPLVAVYLVVVLGMAAVATGTIVPLAILGAWVFVLSDAILARSRFLSHVGGDRRAWRVANHATYHAAQALLVLSLVA